MNRSMVSFARLLACLLLPLVTSRVVDGRETPSRQRRLKDAQTVPPRVTRVIAEILVFNRPLSDAEKAAVMAYLAAKWDLE